MAHEQVVWIKFKCEGCREANVLAPEDSEYAQMKRCYYCAKKAKRY